MKFNHHYHFYSRIGISLLIFVFGFFLWQKSVDTRAVVPNVYVNNTPIVGWAYNDKMGWIAMSCANDFDGDGVPEGGYNSSGVAWGSCSVVSWGLKMASTMVDDDDEEATPDVAVNHVQGCAWAGNIGAVGGYESTTPGWICFSNPSGASTAAPTEGVLMTKTGGTYSTCSCEIIRGTCPVGSPINSGNSCFSYGDCTGTNTCVAGSCSISNLLCSTNFDCQVACESETSAFLGRGVCFDHSPGQESILNNYRGYVPPFTGILTDDPSMTLCYINKDCVAGSECVYPQYGISLGGGTGKCMENSSTEQSPSASCVYDFDCVGYCALALTGILPNAPTSCLSASCIGGYEKVYLYNTIDSLSFFNALSTSPSLADGFASILKMESVTTTSGYEDANKIGFPIGNEVEDSYTKDIDPKYDIDNPNNSINTNNPLRGCFNCYQEKIYKCASNGRSCTCDQNLNSCVVPACKIDLDDLETCSIYSLAPAVCENCQEYFYYTENKRTCSIRTDIICTTGVECLSGFGGCADRKEGDLEKVLTGFNCSNCIVDNEQNSCSLNALNTNSNRCQKCRTFVSGDLDVSTSYNSNVYRLGGVLYDNQHGRSSTSTLCGWGWNAWKNNQCSISKIPCTVSSECTLGGETCRSNVYGFGWINFSPRISNNNPYFSVEKGNIYSKGNITARYQPPINKYNASYLIEAGGTITNFVSGASKSPTSTLAFQGEMPNRPLINFLTPISTTNTNYKNALGKLDYNGLITTARTTTFGEIYNKYNSEIKTYTVEASNDCDSRDFLDSNNALNNKVLIINPCVASPYVSVGSGMLGYNDITIEAGSANESGAGIIVVKGNLFINADIKYDTTSITNIKQIPSLVWIIKGDLIIDESVTEVAGTFIVLGNGEVQASGRTDCHDLVQWAPTADPPGGWYSYAGCGQFQSLWIDTSYGQPFENQIIEPLKIIGNVLARKFELVRTYTDSLGTPAEQFINDGRLQTNPPLGLSDMSKVIPRFSSY
jgi:hypothetical protein